MATKSKRQSMDQLSSYAKELTAEIRRFAHGLRRSQDVRPGMLSDRDDAQRVKVLTETMQTVAAAFQELREVIPANIFTNWGVESRLLGLMLIGQWLGVGVEAEGEAEPTCGLHGNTGTIPMTGVIEFLGMHKKSGALKIEAADEDFLIEFESGDIVHVESTNAPKGSRLGDYLVAQGVDERELERAITKYQRSRLTVGQIVSRENLVDNEQLRAALRQQMHALVARTLAAGNASFRFEESSGRGAMERVRLNVTQLLLETARVVDEAARDAGARKAGEALEAAPSLAAVDSPATPPDADVFGWGKTEPPERSDNGPGTGPQIRRGSSQFF